MLPEDRARVPLHHRIPALLAVSVARLLTGMSPRIVRRVLLLLRRGARPATGPQALTARRRVVGVSSRCAGEGCLQRSVATALLCRLAGQWPEWCVGIRTRPFRSHAWVQVDGLPVGETFTTGYYRPVMRVPPRA